ncbi:hypothetical protein IWQ61_002244 [Dispira simplex]|nr:hypothetical protein IWQ61_002244 [Dispira simplex]
MFGFPFASSSEYSYQLEIEKQPYSGEASYGSSFTSNMLTPALIVRLYTYNDDGEEVDNVQPCMAQAKLYTEDGTQALELVHTDESNMSRALLGQVVAVSQNTEVNGEWGTYFIFDSLSICVPGRYTIAVKL